MRLWYSLLNNKLCLKERKMTVGVIHCKNVHDYWKKVKEIHDDYAKRTGYRLTLSVPAILPVCPFCARVIKECYCKREAMK
jgi:hypothetical protein